MFRMTAVASPPRILRPDDRSVVEVVNPMGAGPFVFACEHASNRIPRAMGSLGLTPAALRSHIAWDPGALDVAMRLSDTFDAPLVVQHISRLVFDCNRAPLATKGIAEQSENQPIPANRDLSEAEVAARIQEVYQPFHDALRELLRLRLAKASPTILLTIHSFTPQYLGQTRRVELGVIHDADSSWADQLLRHGSEVTGLKVRRNEPYGPADEVTHTLQQHGVRNKLPNAMLEIRNDLIRDEPSARQVAGLIANLLRAAWATDQTQIRPDHGLTG